LSPSSPALLLSDSSPPRSLEIEEELEEEKLSAEALALRELKSVQEQLQALEMAIEKMAKR